MATHFFQDLHVWQRSMELAEEVYKLTNKLPQSEVYGLSSQMRRAAVSVPSNIAEGQKRLSRNEAAHFLGIATGSLAELETQLILCQKIYDLDVAGALELCTETGKMASGLLKSLRAKP